MTFQVRLTEFENLWYEVILYFLEDFMANRHQSAIKAARQSLKRQERNRSILRRVKTFMKKVPRILSEAILAQIDLPKLFYLQRI